MFNTARFTAKSGLVGFIVVSSWTLAATSSSHLDWLIVTTSPALLVCIGNDGIDAAVYNSSHQVEGRAPNANTFLEFIKARYGVHPHLVFMDFSLMTNITVTTVLLTRSPTVVKPLTSPPTATVCFLFPVDVVLHPIFGGLKAAILTDHDFGILVFYVCVEYQIFCIAYRHIASHHTNLCIHGLYYQ